MTPVTITLKELHERSAFDLGVSDWFTVGQPRIDQFAEATQDHQWIHVDPTRAAEGPFGSTIAHGYLTLSLVPHLLDGLLTISDQKRGTNYGIDSARFTYPVRVGSEIRLAGRISSTELRADEGIKYAVEIQIQIKGQERPALVGTFLYLAYRS